MQGNRVVVGVIGVGLAAGLVGAGPLSADVIHLKNGHRLEVEAWRDLGDAVEFSSGGGIVRIAKAEVQRVEGKPTRGDLAMYSSGVSASEASAVDQVAAAKQMAGLLREGDALFAQTVLSGVEKAGAFRRLSDKWREVSAPEALRETHARGERALQMAAAAFTPDPDATGSEASARVEAAKTELRAAQDEVKKVAGEAS